METLLVYNDRKHVRRQIKLRTSRGVQPQMWFPQSPELLTLSQRSQQAVTHDPQALTEEAECHSRFPVTCRNLVVVH